MDLPASSDLVELLGNALPDGAMVTDPDRVPSYTHDRSTGTPSGQPLAVVFARSTGQVQTVLRAAHALRVPVVPRGAGSGLAGGSNAVDGGIVLSLEKMDEVTRVHEHDGFADVQPGVLNTQLRDHVRPYGLWYAPDPASKDFCSIGGNVNTNAGGLCCVKYGVTRDSVLGLEVVLADGRVTHLGRRSVKGVAGYDLLGLMVGSEGTLGVVTQARLRLRPLPPPPTTVVGLFDDVVAAGRAVQTILATTTPSLLELMDRTTVRAVEAFQPMGLDTDAAALLLAQSDLPGAAGEAEADAMLAACETAGAVEGHRSTDPVEAEQLLGARRMAIHALEWLGDWLLDDIAVPRSRLAEAIARIEDVADRRGLTIGTFGHAGDGNLHPTVIYPRGDEEAAQRALLAFDDLLVLALELGGTVTGEHGVGLMKRRRLDDELDDAAVSLHHAVKRAWDPAGILNPGKALPLR
ncbi:MAG TPA: FAD-linked oxidase C-terminal domain-containing protein [Actinomycetes bacterium]